MVEPVLIIHGGAGRSFKDSKRPELLRKKISKILKKSYEKLFKTDAVKAVVYATQLLEDDPEFNAGTGSRLQADGKARLSASLMDGKTEKFAGVINIERIKNPILVAKALLGGTDRVLSGEGAFLFAKKLGFKTTDTRTQKTIRQWEEWRKKALEDFKKRSYDTVGACALDRFGNLASATSTGGRGFEMPGRVSDSGMPVANFADARCAISASGIGEDIIDEGLAIKIATRVRDGSTLSEAFAMTFRDVAARNRKIGAIGLDQKGNITWETTTEVLIYGWQKGSTFSSF